MKKAQGLSLTTIVVAALALLVLVVLVLIFTGRIGGFSIGVDKSSTCEVYCPTLGDGWTSTAQERTECQGADQRFIAAIKTEAGDSCCCVKTP